MQKHRPGGGLLITIEIVALIAVITMVAIRAMGGGLSDDKKYAKETTEAASEAGDLDSESGGDSEKGDSSGKDDGSGDASEKSEDSKNSDASGDKDASSAGNLTVSDGAAAKAASMSNEDKVSQLFFITPEQLTHVKTVVATGSTTVKKVNQYPVGGLSYQSGNFTADSQASDMLTSLQNAYNDKLGARVFVSYRTAEGETADTAKLSSYGVNAALSNDGNGAFGLTFTADDPSAKASGLKITKVSSPEDAVNAITGGSDMVYLPDNFEDSYNAVLDAINQGTITQDALNNAVGRILTVKGL